MLHRRRQVGVRSKYAKIPVKTKLKFLRKVLLEGFSIRDVIPPPSRLPPSSTSTTPPPRHSSANTRPLMPNSTPPLIPMKQTP